MFFLVEHSFGFTCSQLVVIEKDRIMAAFAAAALCATRPEARQGSPNPRRGGRRDPPNDGSSRRASAAPIGWFAKAATSARTKPSTLLKGLLRSSRLRVGLSFREASGMSRWIASTLSDELYFAAPSTLSDYETLSDPPRHIQKIITLAALLHADQVIDRIIRLLGDPDGTASLRACRD